MAIEAAVNAVIGTFYTRVLVGPSEAALLKTWLQEQPFSGKL